MAAPNQITIAAVKVGTVLANLSSIVGFSFCIAERTSNLPTKSGLTGLNVVFHLSVLTAIAFGVLWSLAERQFGWSFGAGGGDALPSGWSAVVLSVCMTLPLAVVPFLYQLLSGVHVLFPSHWRAMLFVILLGVGCHLLIYGTTSDKPNGLRQWIAPAGEETPFGTGLLIEFVYSSLFVGLWVLSYRLVVNPTEPLLEILLGRTLLPCLVFFSGMAVFIALKYPGSLNDRRLWCEKNGRSLEGEVLINTNKDVAIIHDLWNLDKHGQLDRTSRSSHYPRIQGLTRYLNVSTGTAPGSYALVTFHPRTGEMRTGTPDGGAAKLVINGDVVDEHGTQLADFATICKSATVAWEKTLIRAGVSLPPAHLPPD